MQLARFRSDIGKPSLPRGWCSTGTGCPEESGNLPLLLVAFQAQLRQSYSQPDLLLAMAVLQGGLD